MSNTSVLEAFSSGSFPGDAWVQSAPNVFMSIVGDNPTESNPFRNFNAFINSFFFSASVTEAIVAQFGVHVGHYFMCYVRNLVAGIILYYGTAGTFHYFNYVHPRSKEIFKNRAKPSSATIMDQIKLAQASLFLYVALPVFSDYLIEEQYTRCYYHVSDIGGMVPYLLYTVLYFIAVEIGIYWMHRKLHENNVLFEYVHQRHHAYNTPETLTPWASIAFNPVDGILQASPYVFWLLFIPCHYFTHVGMVFLTAVWATYIHDSMYGNVEPIMGNKYHTVHHTHYRYNYGQIFIFCDWYWGTLRVPQEDPAVAKWKKQQAEKQE